MSTTEPWPCVLALPSASRVSAALERHAERGEEQGFGGIPVADRRAREHGVADERALFLRDEFQLGNVLSLPKLKDEILFPAVRNLGALKGRFDQFMDTIIIGLCPLPDNHRNL